MACTDYPEYWQFLANFQFFDAIYCPFADLVGPLLFPLLVFGGLGVALYVYSNSLIMPLTLSIILGGVVVVQLPSGPVRLIGIVVLFGVGMAGYMLVQRLED
jgi:hypothetical protein